VLRLRLFYLFLDVRFIWSDWFHSKPSEAVLRVVPDTGQPGDRGLHRTVAIVADDHAVIDHLQLVYVAALDDLLQAVAQLRFIVYAPPPGMSTLFAFGYTGASRRDRPQPGYPRPRHGDRSTDYGVADGRVLDAGR